MAKLSSFQRKTLEAIARHGGGVHAAGGGYWNCHDGARLDVEPEPDSCSGIVGTQTIYALENRGLLERANVIPVPDHKAPRRITEAGRAAIFRI